MPKQSVVCYLVSLLFYGMGSSKISAINSGHFTSNVFQATLYYVLAIWLILIGSVSYYAMTRRKRIRRLRNRRRVAKVQLSQNINLDRRMTS
jgi:H+/Cl- antiporter ClcA